MKGTRHQEAARPAARGHYILHSPRDELADDPSRNRQRDFKMLLAYEITTPTHEDFGNVQSELGIEEKGAVVLQVKDPNVKDNSNNPRAANMPREKKAHVSEQPLLKKEVENTGTARVAADTSSRPNCRDCLKTGAGSPLIRPPCSTTKELKFSFSRRHIRSKTRLARTANKWSMIWMTLQSKRRLRRMER